MRILLAVDGSEPAALAARLVSSIGWPPDSLVVALAVVQPPLDPGLGMPGLPLAGDALQEMAGAVRDEAERVVTAAVEGLEADGRTVELRVVEGRPASVITETARSMAADLVVVGSHGYGRIASAVLGSVSSEVAEFAPCSVLVARTGSISRLVLADDGSESSEAARRLVASMPGFAGMPVTVVSVAETLPDWYAWLPPESGPAIVELADVGEAEERRLRRFVGDQVRTLNEAGLTTTGEVRAGDPAGAIVAGAEETAADLIVMGSRGLTPLESVVLGSVSRKVLLRAHCSVLIARPRPRTR
jgi:nucleotide-binding universal stress UspA family protein